MKSNKQRRAEIKAKRLLRAAKKIHIPFWKYPVTTSAECEGIDEAMLARYSSYDVPEFIARGYYLSLSFRCRDCGVDEIWTAKQQKWWYENAQGGVFTKAIRCRACRALKRANQAHSEAMRVAGIAGMLNMNKQKSKDHEHAN